MPWLDVNLPHGWYLNPDRVLVPATNRAQLTADLSDYPTFVDSTHQDTWFTDEHD